MKSIIVAACIMLNINAFAAKELTVPAPVKTAFMKEFPQASAIKWEQEDGKYEAHFNNANQEMSATYTPAGVKEETETRIAIDKLPEAARTYAQAKGNIKEASLIVKADGTRVYEAEVGGVDLIFSETGAFIKEVKE